MDGWVRISACVCVLCERLSPFFAWRDRETGFCLGWDFGWELVGSALCCRYHYHNVDILDIITFERCQTYSQFD